MNFELFIFYLYFYQNIHKYLFDIFNISIKSKYWHIRVYHISNLEYNKRGKNPSYPWILYLILHGFRSLFNLKGYLVNRG